MDTKIISAFPGCGKTYLYENQVQLGLSVSDSDSSKYDKVVNWEVAYVDDVLRKMKDYDFVFISQHSTVLSELDKRGVSFYCVVPNNSFSISDSERQLIKQQWFGRFLLRDNSFIKSGFQNWLDVLLKNYDTWTNPDNFSHYKNCKEVFLLNQDEYLVDVINRLKCDSGFIFQEVPDEEVFKDRRNSISDDIPLNLDDLEEKVDDSKEDSSNFFEEEIDI